MANWDEDSVTMRWRPERDCLPAADPLKDRSNIDALYFASTTMPFADRQNAGIVSAALVFSQNIRLSMIAARSERGFPLYRRAAHCESKQTRKVSMLVGGERRRRRAPHRHDWLNGDAAAACLGERTSHSQFIASHSVKTTIFVKIISRGVRFDYGGKTLVRDEGFTKLFLNR